ncbi:unnamed protein product [Prorocentrum cordatum]|uniref:DNA (cytosine-5-)-methyltransferase n=1 Tax=Prorocentrum cordatum TaxID=2364126 RepID=A0ABN9TZT8_9DINO|nr:unnamed protein product [Polarella glacialis]
MAEVVDDGDDVEELADLSAPGPRARPAAAAGADQLPVEDVELVALVDGKLHASVGYNNAPEVQCQFVWLCQRHSRCRRLAPVRLLWMGDSYWDWWSQHLLHICEGPVPLCEAELPSNCTELVHTSEVARLTVEAAAELWLQYRATNPGAVWPQDLLGPPPGAARPAEAPAAGAHPFEDLLGELDEEPSAPSGVAALRSRLMKSKDRFAALRDRDKGAAPSAEGAAQAALAVEAGPEVKRPLAEAPSERAAKVARGGPKLLAAPPPSDGGARGARDRGPTEGAAASAGASRAAQEIAVDPQGAIVLLRLLAVDLPQHPVRGIGAPARRDLQTLAQALDLLVQGRSAASADLLARRFKSLQVVLHAGNWSGAKWLEGARRLESLPLSEVSESVVARRRRSPAEFGRPTRRVDLAVKLARFAQLHPGALGRLAGQALPFEGGGAKARVRDLPPLPFPPLEEVARWAQAVKGSRRRLAPVARAVASEAWAYMSVLGLNRMRCGVARESLRLGATLTLAQETATRRIRSRTAEFVQQPFETVAVASLGDTVATSSVDYIGGPTMRALPRALAELAPGPPKRGPAATLGAIGFVDDEVARWLADPALALKAEANFPDPLPKGRVNVGSQFEREAPAMHLVDFVIFTVLPAEELVRVLGEPLLNGLFAAEKKDGGPLRVARAPCMHRYTAVGRPVAGSLFGRLEPEGCRASAAIGMGWSLAAPVHRRIHGRLRRLSPPLGAGLPPQAERRKDAPRPVAAAAEEGDPARWQVYIDDFDAPEIVEEVRARASSDRAGVAYSAEKAHCRQLRVERMGADAGGESGCLAAPLAKSLEAIALCLASFRLEAVPWRLAMAILGRYARLSEFRGPLFSVLNEVWRLSSQRGSARFSAAMVEELLAAMLVMPMAATSLRAKIEGMAAVSDAPEFGGGARASVGPRAEAEASLGGAPTLDEQMHLGARLLQLPAEPFEPWAVANPLTPRAAVLRAPKVLLVGLFDGIGGLAMAFSRLPVRAMGFVAAETGAKARRAARLRWPGAIDWGDAARVTAAVVNELRGAYCDEVDLCAAAAGSPCQDLARLSAPGAGLRGAKSGFFYEVPRLLELLKAALGHKLKWFVENVASTLCWLSWGPHVAALLAAVARGGLREVRAPRGPLCELAWQGEGARWLGAPGLFPTAAGSVPRPPSSSERERVLGFDVNCAPVAAKGSNERDCSEVRAFLPGNSFSAHVVAWLAQAVLLGAKTLSRPLEVQQMVHFGWRRLSRGAIGRHEGAPGGPGALASRRSVLHYLARAEKGGADVRLDCGPPYSPRGWAAVAVAGDMRPVVGYVVSEDNPADEPSEEVAAWGALRAQSLFLLRVGAATRHRHSAAVDRLLEHSGVAGGGVEALGQGGEGADALVAGHREVLWASGAGIAAANDAAAGACFFSPRFRRRMDLSWALLKTWRKRGPAARVPHFAPEIVGAMAGLALEAGCVDVACLLMVAFEGLARGGEAFAPCRGDVAFRGQRAVLRIASPKDSAGREAVEAVVIRAPITPQLLRLATRGLDEVALVEGLGFQRPLSWHSCRRGGASECFLRTKSMELTLVRGRWASSLAARIYVEGALADLARVQRGDAQATLARQELQSLRVFSELLRGRHRGAVVAGVGGVLNGAQAASKEVAQLLRDRARDVMATCVGGVLKGFRLQARG